MKLPSAEELAADIHRGHDTAHCNECLARIETYTSAVLEAAAECCEQMVKLWPPDIFIPPPAGEHGQTVDAWTKWRLTPFQEKGPRPLPIRG